MIKERMEMVHGKGIEVTAMMMIVDMMTGEGGQMTKDDENEVGVILTMNQIPTTVAGRRSTNERREIDVVGVEVTVENVLNEGKNLEKIKDETEVVAQKTIIQVERDLSIHHHISMIHITTTVHQRTGSYQTFVSG